MTQDKEKDIVYPPGVHELTEDISTDDFVRRLKECAKVFQSMSQDDDNSAYIPLALHLSTETFLEHKSPDVRLFAACCLADVFRVYAPEAPYNDTIHVQAIFEFFVEQLKGLKDPSNPLFKHYFYLLENFSCVKTFNICLEFEDYQKIVKDIFNLFFSIISDKHSSKVKSFMVDLLTPLIIDSDTVPQPVLDILLSHIIEPWKSQKKTAHQLAYDILKRTITTLEPYVKTFFNEALLEGKSSRNNLTRYKYHLIYELNAISPDFINGIIGHLEFKFKSSDEKERYDVINVVARMFSDKKSDMIKQNTTLWSSFLSRFNDISPQIRILCVNYTHLFLLNHPEMKDDITEQLRLRYHDVEENVRSAVVENIIKAAKQDFSSISDELLGFVKDRSLDKKFSIRKVALLGLASLYKQYNSTSDDTPISNTELESISWIKNKVLHLYYLNSLEDRLLVERIIHSCLVPYQKPIEERMRMLYQLYCSIDENATRAFKEILRCQKLLRSQMKNLVGKLQDGKPESDKAIMKMITKISKTFPDPENYSKKLASFCKEIEKDIKLRNTMFGLLEEKITCAEAQNKVQDILKNFNKDCKSIQTLLERTAPLMLDKLGIQHLVSFVKNALLGDGSVDAKLKLHNSSHKGLALLLTLSQTFPSYFQTDEVYEDFLCFLKTHDSKATAVTMQILCSITKHADKKFANVFKKLIPILENCAESGTSKQAKNAIYCINNIVSDKETVFGNLIKNLNEHLTLESQHYQTSLVSIGHIAYLCGDIFACNIKEIAKKIIRDLIMLDRDLPRGGDDLWGPFDSLPDETKCKIEGMKVLVRWLAGLRSMVTAATSTMKLLYTLIDHNGDLMKRQHSAPMENSWMRLSAASCMLKLYRESEYASAITRQHFHALAFLMIDPCHEVRDRFAQKINKGLLYLNLPLPFLAVLCLSALDERKEFKNKVKNFLMANVCKRREYIKEHTVKNDELPKYVPDYAIQYAVYILSKAPFYKCNDVQSLTRIRDCLNLLLSVLVGKHEDYSYSFFKTLLENIKHTKDIDTPEEDEANIKLYAVCDLALNTVNSQPNVTGDSSLQLPLDSEFFQPVDRGYSNLKTYLPPGLVDAKKAKVRFGVDHDMFDTTKVNTSSLLEETQNMDSQSDRSVPSMMSNPSSIQQESNYSTPQRKSARTRVQNSQKNSVEDMECETTIQDSQSDNKSSYKTESSNLNDTMPASLFMSPLQDRHSESSSSSSHPKKVPKPIVRRTRKSLRSRNSEDLERSMASSSAATTNQNGADTSSDFQQKDLKGFLMKDFSILLNRSDVSLYSSSSESPIASSSKRKSSESNGLPPEKRRLQPESPIKNTRLIRKRGGNQEDSSSNERLSPSSQSITNSPDSSGETSIKNGKPSRLARTKQNPIHQVSSSGRSVNRGKTATVKNSPKHPNKASNVQTTEKIISTRSSRPVEARTTRRR